MSGQAYQHLSPPRVNSWIPKSLLENIRFTPMPHLLILGALYVIGALEIKVVGKCVLHW